LGTAEVNEIETDKMLQEDYHMDFIHNPYTPPFHDFGISFRFGTRYRTKDEIVEELIRQALEIIRDHHSMWDEVARRKANIKPLERGFWGDEEVK
jgi:hypothetical protein